MCAQKMHADELEIDAALVRRLLASQFPRWAGLPLARVASSGTDNAIFRLGDDMAVRLPRIRRAEAQIEKEQRWLPQLAPQLPLAVPVPIAVGSPGEGYPCRWSVCPWLPGEEASGERIGDLCRAAIELAAFITALQRIDPAGGPPPGEHNFLRGVPLSRRDAQVRAAIEAAGDMIDAAVVTAAWEDALRAPVWDETPVWIHGDLQSGNLLVQEGRLSAVIDFGGLGVGDPACELMVAWSLFSGESRDVFRAALGVDGATWARGRGWALCAVIALPYYRTSNPVIVANALRTIAEVLADPQSGT
jgi:aminoglycoside phosphotransferase (APT) family kinase protein